MRGVRERRIEANSTTGDYVKAMFRQDGLVYGLMAHLAGKELMPDPAYSPLKPAVWDELKEGVWPEYQNELMQAHSAAHALYLKGLLMDKQDDVERLDVLGLGGNIARIAINVLMPDQLLMAIAGGWVAKGLKTAELASNIVKVSGSAAARVAGSGGVKAAQALAYPELGTALAAAAAKRGGTSTASAAVGGIAFGAAESALYEKLRQSVNFEHDASGVLAAGLLGGAMTAPFAIAGARAERRIGAAASRESEALNHLHDLNNGEALTPKAAKDLDDVIKAHEAVRKVETGEATPDQVRAHLDAIHGTEDKAFLDQLQQKLATDGGKYLDEVFPLRVADRTAKQFVPDGQPLALPYDPSVKDGVIHALPVDSMGNVLPSTSPMAIDAELSRISKRRHPKSPEKAERWAMDQRSKLLGLDPVHMAKVAAGKAESRVPVAAAERQASVAEAFGMAESNRAALKVDASAKELSALVNSSTAPEALPRVPKDHAGKFVSWADESGTPGEGMATGRTPEGKVTVKAASGELHEVADVHLDTAIANGDAVAPEGFMANSIGAAQVQAIKAVSENTTAFSRARLDIFAKLNRSQSLGVRELAFDLVKDAIQVDRHQAQAMSASEWKSHFKRTFTGAFHVESRKAAYEARVAMKVPLWGKLQFEGEFHSLVSRLTRGDVDVLAQNPDIAPMLQKASSAQKLVYQRFLEEAKKAGVKGAEDLDINGQYVNRIWDHTGIRNAILAHGEEAVHGLLAKAINVPGHVGDVAKAKSFLSTVRKLEFAPVMQNIQLYAQDMGTLRRALTEAGNLDESDINGLVDLMFSAKESAGNDAGRQANLKYRFDLDEKMATTLNTGVLRISDLLENDARVLADVYGNSMAGHIGMAKKGIYSQADFMERLRVISDEGMKNPQWDTKGLGADVKLLQDMYNNVTGKPMSTADFSASARIAATARGYTRSVMLGQLGIASMFEMKQAVATLGFKTFLKQMPALSSMFSAMRNGYIPDVQLARDIEHMAGFGTEMASNYVRAAEIDEGMFGQMLSRAEHGANVTSHAVDILSGNASFTSLTKQLSGMMATQRMHDYATGLRTLTPEMRTRFVGWGVDDDRLDGMLNMLRDHSTATPGHKLETVDYERWLELSPHTYEDFQTAMSRMTRDAIQDHDIGETMPFMHSTLGKVFSELKTFFLVAHAKNFLKNAHYRDATAFQVWAIGFIGESLAYMTQNAANNLHDPEKMLANMDPEKVARAAFFRSPALGALPMFVDTGYGVLTGGDSLVAPGMTTNTDSRSFLNPPSLIVAKRLLNAPMTMMGLAAGTDVTTRQEGRDLAGILPGSNLYGVKNLANYLVNSLPVADQSQR